MRSIWAVPIIVSILILTSLGFSQDAFALNTFITDEPSCENAPVFGTFDSGTCVLSGLHTIPLHDTWNFVIASKNTGTVDVFGLLQVRVSFSNSGTINVIGDTSGVGNRALFQFNFGTDYTNECNGIINLIGGDQHRNGWLLIANSGGLDPIFNNFGTITGTNSDIPNQIGVILLDGAPITVNNHGTLTAPVLVGQGIFNDNLPNQCAPPPQADLMVDIGSGPQLIGTEYQTPLTVHNDGPNTAENVVVTVVIDTAIVDLQLVTSTPPGTCTQTLPDTAICSLGDIGPNNPNLSVGLIFEMPLGSTGLISTTVTISSDTDDPNTGNDVVSSDTLIVPSSDLMVVKSCDDILSGEQSVCTITVTNNGPNDATANLFDYFPLEFTFVSASDPDAIEHIPDPDSVSGLIEFSEFTIANQESIEFTVTIEAPVVIQEEVFTNEAEVTALSQDPNITIHQDTNLSNNFASTTFTVSPIQEPEPEGKNNPCDALDRASENGKGKKKGLERAKANNNC